MLSFAGDTTNGILQAFLSSGNSGVNTWQIAFSGSGSTQVASIFDRYSTNSTSVVKNGSGVLTITGGGTAAPTSSNQGWYRGGTTLNAGTLNVNNAYALGGGGLTITGGTLGNTSGTAITLLTNNTQTWSGDFGFAGTSNLNLGTGAVSLGSATRTVTVSANTLTVGGGISGSGGLTKTGAGTLTLSASNSYSGTTTVNQGTLLVTDANALRGTTFAGGAGTLAFGGIAAIGSDNYFYVGGLSGSSALSLTGTNGTAVRLNFGLNNADTTFSGNVTGTSVNQFVEKVGTGTTTISGNWTAGSPGLTGGGLSVLQGGIRQVGGVVTANRNEGSAALNIGIGSGTTGSYVLESGTLNAITGPLANVRIGSSGGTGILTIDGVDARARFSGTNNTIGGNDLANNSGTGTLNLRAGELAVNSLTTGTVAGSQGTFNFSGGTLRPYSQDTSIGQSGTGFTIALSGNSPTLSGLDAAAGTARNLTILTSLLNASGTTGGINVSGGTVTLSAANTYSGATTIAGTNATLRLSAAGSFANSSTIRVGSAGSSGAVLDLTSKTSGFTFGSGQTVGGIGTLNIGAGRTVTSAGIWAPGNSIGSNAVTGNLTLSGTSQFELGTPGASTTAPGFSDFTAVSGTLTLGGNLQLINNAGADGNGSVAGGVYRLFTYGNAVSGSFASVTNPSATTRTSLGNISYAGSGTAAGNGVFLSIYNLASPSIVSGTSLNLGTVLKGTSLSQSLAIANAAPGGSFSEKLDVAFGSLSGAASTNGGSISLLTAGGTSSAMSVGLASTTAGAQSGSVQLTFASNGDGTSGLAPLALDPQTVSLTATVLDPATASFNALSTLTSGTVSIGSFNQNTGVHTLGFSIFNLLSDPTYTADLTLLSITDVGTPFNSLSIDLTPALFGNLQAGGSSSWVASLSSLTTGSFTNRYQLNFESSKNGVSLGGPQSMTLTVTGVIIVPEPGALALAGIGIAAAAYALRSRSPSRKRAG
jgi:autotransporter-associated beta strand protein